MSESEGDDVVNEKDSSMFPVDGKFYSEKEKSEIMALSEVKREAILAERAQILEQKQIDQALQRLFEGYQAKDGNKQKVEDGKKRKAGTTDLEEGQRKSSRQKTTLGGRKVGETSDAMVAYKRQREQKGVLAEQRKTEYAQRKALKGEEGSDADASGVSEVEWDDAAARSAANDVAPPPHRDVPAELIDFEHTRLGRARFGEVCFNPGFENAIKDCYARVSVGPDKLTGENVYRVAKIKGLNSLLMPLFSY
jgi:RNA polymerase-associated protein RTF1